MLRISDNLWNRISNLIPTKESKVGRPQKDPRIILSGIIYIMVTGAQWRYLPDYYGRPTTVHGRFGRWIYQGVFDRILLESIEAAIQELGTPECFFTDTSSVKAPFAKFGGKNPTDRAKNGIKKGIIIDWNRIILSILIAGANQHDSKLLLPHIDHIKRFIDHPKVLATDSAWDVKSLRKKLTAEKLVLLSSVNVRRNKNRDKFRPKGRWRVEQVFGIQQWNRGLKTCWAKIKSSFLALCQLASAIHNFRLIGIFG